MKHHELGKSLYKISHLTGEFTLRSGAVSHQYFDKYQFTADPALLAAIAEKMLRLIPTDTEMLAGLEMGGIPIATVLSQLSGLPSLFVRKKPKAYGTAKLAEGADFKGRKLTIVEDIVSSGGQIILSCQELRKRGAQITDALCVIDRSNILENGKNSAHKKDPEECITEGMSKLAEHGIKLHSIFTMNQLESLFIEDSD